MQQVARRAPAGLTGAEAARRWVERVADQVLSHPTVVRLAAPAPEVPADLCRRDGRSFYEAHGAPLFSTLATLAREQEVLDAAVAGREARRALAHPEDTEVAIALHGLDADQAQAVRRLALDGESIICLIGPAGAGKSRAMGAAAEAWADSGIAVRGLAVSAAAAGVLEAEAGIPCENIAKFLFEHGRPGGAEGRWRLGRNEVVVIDEAAMASSFDLAKVVALATAAEAKVVLVGDHRQLGAVEAGGLFRLLASKTSAAELTGVRRFHALWEREASLRLRDGDKTVIEEYRHHGRVVGGDREVWSRKPSCAGNWPGPEAIRWWSAPPTTPPWTSWQAEPERPEWPPAKSKPKAWWPVNGSWVWVTRSSPVATTGAWSPPVGVGCATAIAGRCWLASTTTASWSRISPGGDEWCCPPSTSEPRSPWPTR